MARPRKPENVVDDCCLRASEPYHVSPFTGRPVKRPWCRDDYERLVVWSTRQGFGFAANGEDEETVARTPWQPRSRVIARVA